MNITPMQVTLIDSMGSDLSVVNAARVSFHKESHEVVEQDARLISYLSLHGHWTPFAHAFLSFRIKAPIFVARQLVKHQVGLAWNEVSRRYVSDEPEFWIPSQWRGKPTNAKQGSSGTFVTECEFFDESVGEMWTMDIEEAQYHHIESCLKIYNAYLKAGMAPEQARMVLPLNAHTEWIWSGSLMAFARVCKLRLDPHAQAETREIAEHISNQVPEKFNLSWGALVGEQHNI